MHWLTAHCSQVFTPVEEGTIRALLPDKIFAVVLKVVLIVGPEGPEDLEVKQIEIFACFEEESTTVTTTTQGTTTTMTTTTKVTPTTTSVTTVETTTVPATTFTGICYSRYDILSVTHFLFFRNERDTYQTLTCTVLFPC